MAYITCCVHDWRRHPPNRTVIVTEWDRETDTEREKWLNSKLYYVCFRFIRKTHPILLRTHISTCAELRSLRKRSILFVNSASFVWVHTTYIYTQLHIRVNEINSKRWNKATTTALWQRLCNAVYLASQQQPQKKLKCKNTRRWATSKEPIYIYKEREKITLNMNTDGFVSILFFFFLFSYHFHCTRIFKKQCTCM